MTMDHVTARPGHLIRRAQQISAAIFAEECAAADITSVQYAALVAVREHPGVDATRLSALIAFDRSTLGDVIERLEAKGLLRRVAGAADRRVKLLHLTAAGAALLVDVEPAVERVQQRLLAPLAPEERAVFMRLLGRMVDQNNEASRAPLGAMAER